jgi:hypothetical protein
MSPDELRAIGERLWGRWGWQTRMAETLRVDGSTVRRWLSGATTIPGPAEVALELLLERREAGNPPHRSERQQSDEEIGGQGV